MLGNFQHAWVRAWSFVSPYRPVIVGLLTLVVLWILYKLSTRAIRRYLRSRSQKPENVQRFLFFWRYLWVAVGLVFVLISFSGSFTALGISAAFLGMIVGWSLQAPVTGIAAWLMILLKRPFKIGDRIIVAGIIGDVVDISLTHILLNQVGGTVDGEEKSGRGVLIPNAILFQQIIHNYCFENTYILDEVPVLVTYESDLALAERICVRAAEEVTGRIIQDTGKPPFTRVELDDSGIRIRVRYRAVAFERQTIGSDIVRAIVREFNQSDRVEFAYPHTEVLYRPKDGATGQAAPELSP